ncbi:MAG: TrmB family transcriptional regulator [Promethearchaeota archaeon]
MVIINLPSNSPRVLLGSLGVIRLKNIDQEVYAALKEFGLTDYETRAYVTLVINGTSSAKDISDDTGIPYSRIYDVLTALENRGWVLVQQGRPMLYQAARPLDVSQLARKEIESKFKRIETALVEKLEPLFGNSEEVDATPIWILRGNVEKKVRELLDAVQKNVYVLLASGREEELKFFFDDFLKAHTRKVDVSVIVPTGYSIHDKMLWRKMDTISKVKETPNPPFDGFVFDDSDAIIFLSSFVDITVQEENMTFWISDLKLVSYLKTYFNMVWNLGKNFEY